MVFIKRRLEYIWIDGNGSGRTRSKTKVETIDMINNDNIDPKFFSDWNYDGSSCNQADTKNSEILMKPVFICPDPLNDPSKDKLVFCASYKYENMEGDKIIPAKNNYYDFAKEIFDKSFSIEPWFGIEQEYFLIDKSKYKEDFNYNGIKKKEDKPEFKTVLEYQGNYYCGVGYGSAIGRKVANEHLNMCIKANLEVSGMNGEVAPGQWEFQIGIAHGIQAAHHLWVARYLLERVAEKYNLKADFTPTPIKEGSLWNGSGCHTNFSYKKMRTIKYEWKKTVELLKDEHKLFMENYGTNDERMTGYNETSKIDEFNYGVGDRTCSIRIPRETFINKIGYIEDRRPSSDMNPYLVTGLLTRIIIDNQN